MRAVIETFAATAAAGLARLVTGVHGNWQGCAPDPRPRVYYANHCSHGDFVLIWTVLPPRLRDLTRPVAASDYWLVSASRRFLGERVFRAVFIDRIPATWEAHPVTLMGKALAEGSSLILFPEGTRNMTEERLLPFKAGLYHLAKARPEAELVPVWIENLNRVMPKGELVPIPLLCTVTFGAPVKLETGEDKAAFLSRTHGALIGLAPSRERGR